MCCFIEVFFFFQETRNRSDNYKLQNVFRKEGNTVTNNNFFHSLSEISFLFLVNSFTLHFTSLISNTKKEVESLL